MLFLHNRLSWKSMNLTIKENWYHFMNRLDDNFNFLVIISKLALSSPFKAYLVKQSRIVYPKLSNKFK